MRRGIQLKKDASEKETRSDVQKTTSKEPSKEKHKKEELQKKNHGGGISPPSFNLGFEFLTTPPKEKEVNTFIFNY